MRKEFVETTLQVLSRNEKSALFLGDIGVFGFRHALEKFPDRAFNFGILEQAMVSAAAGFSEKGFHPIVSTIAPFIVNRAFEQIKLDFGYQALEGTFITVGASFDYTSLGATHYCPEDVLLISSIPEIKIYLPGSPQEVSVCIMDALENRLSYVRLSEQTHEYDIRTVGLKTLTNNESKKGVLFFGPALKFRSVIANDDLYMQYYCNELSSLLNCDFSNLEDLTIIADFYLDSVVMSLSSRFAHLKIKTIAPEKKFYRNYGCYSDALSELGCGTDRINDSFWR